MTNLMYEQTLNGMITTRLRKNAVTGKPVGEEGDADVEKACDETAAILGEEMSTMVGAQSLYRTIRKLHYVMLLLGVTTLAVLLASLVQRWYGDSKHARAGLEATTVIFFFCLLIMWHLRNETPVNLLMLLLVNGLAALSLGMVVGLEMCD